MEWHFEWFMIVVNYLKPIECQDGWFELIATINLAMLEYSASGMVHVQFI
jgi:hypothetical protein